MIATNNLNLLKRYLVILCLFLTDCSKQNNHIYSKLEGNVFGTTFHIKYKNVKKQKLDLSLDSLFQELNNSLSTYHPNSLISQFNSKNSSLQIDHHLKNVFLLSKQIYEETEGYFDPTIGKIVNVIGFDAIKTNKIPIKKEIDSLMYFVNFDKVTLRDNILNKQDSEIYLNFNSIAKGYGVDEVGRFLENKNIKNYLVEIGGEIRARGKNENGKDWSVGIEEPNFEGKRSLHKILSLQNEAIATSGNYRKFKLDNLTGKKIVHILNPKTGYFSETDMLSASVISTADCAEVDAYATAFMAMGFKKAKEIALKTPKLKVFFIYLENNEIKTFASKKLKLKKI